MRFGKMVLGSLTGALMAASAAHAADLPARALPPIPPAPIFTWTGFYIGGFAGGHFSETRTVPPTGFTAFKATDSGLVAGGLVGANYQINQFVLGVEGDGGYTDYDKNGSFVGNRGGIVTYRQSAEFNGHVRARVGYAAGSFGFGETLIYAAGGGAFIDNKLTLGNTAGTTGIRRDLAGYTVGGGIEVAVTSSVVVRGEYLYDDYGRTTYAYSTVSGGNLQNRSVQITDSTARAALEYKF